MPLPISNCQGVEDSVPNNIAISYTNYDPVSEPQKDYSAGVGSARKRLAIFLYNGSFR
jgi:hypothetical protein